MNYNFLIRDSGQGLVVPVKEIAPSKIISIILSLNNCDQICEKGSYSFSKCMYLVTHNLICENGSSLKFGHIIALLFCVI